MCPVVASKVVFSVQHSEGIPHESKILTGVWFTVHGSYPRRSSPQAKPKTTWLVYGIVATPSLLPFVPPSVPQPPCTACTSYSWLNQGLWLDSVFWYWLYFCQYETFFRVFFKEWQLFDRHPSILVPRDFGGNEFTFSTFAVLVMNDPFRITVLDSWMNVVRTVSQGKFVRQKKEYTWEDSDQPCLWYALARAHSDFSCCTKTVKECNLSTGLIKWLLQICWYSPRMRRIWPQDSTLGPTYLLVHSNARL